LRYSFACMTILVRFVSHFKNLTETWLEDEPYCFDLLITINSYFNLNHKSMYTCYWYTKWPFLTYRWSLQCTNPFILETISCLLKTNISNMGSDLVLFGQFSVSSYGIFKWLSRKCRYHFYMSSKFLKLHQVLLSSIHDFTSNDIMFFTIITFSLNDHSEIKRFNQWSLAQIGFEDVNPTCFQTRSPWLQKGV
jgi:hypothetical protein